MAGKATIKLGININSIGDPIEKDHSFTVSGVTNTIGIVGQTASATSATLALGPLSNLYGIVIKAISTTSTDTLRYFLSGAASAYWMKIAKGETAMIRPNSSVQGIHVFSSGVVTYEFTAFGV